jgi:multidrug transporter EmrE-like cation transporter
MVIFRAAPGRSGRPPRSLAPAQAVTDAPCWTVISFGLLILALRGLEVGPAYAVWTGIGAVGTAVVGMAALGESVSALKLVSIGLVLAGWWG